MPKQDSVNADILVELVRALKGARCPDNIWQESLDEHDGYNRLRRGGDVSLNYYLDDYQYKDVQPELFRHLLPKLVEHWGEELTGIRLQSSVSEKFFTALAAKPPFPACISANQMKALQDYVEFLILSRMERENSLAHSGAGASPYDWFYALGSYLVVFSGVENFWNSWWGMRKCGWAICTVQYISALMYKNSQNPIFSPWTRAGGGGAPCLWETDAHIYEQCTKPENVNYIEKILTVESVGEALRRANSELRSHPHHSTVQKMLHDYQSDYSLLEYRIPKLMRALRRPKADVFRWNDV